MSIAHFTLATRNVEASARFYQNTFRWRRLNPPANTPAYLEAAWLEITPGQQLHLLYLEDFAPSPFEREYGRHFAFFHPGDDFEALKQRLVDHGAELMDPIRPTVFERFYFRDPSGYIVEVIHREHWTAENP